MRSLSDAAVRAAVWAATVFYRVERLGWGVPPGPSIIVANHPNMLMDPILALYAAGRRVRVIVKAPHFRTPLFGRVLRGQRALPVYRMRDDPNLLHKNKESIRDAVDALCAGEALLVFPEGGSHSGPALAPLKTGAARIALTAEEMSGWELGVTVVPVGLAYHRKHRFRSRVAVGVGEPLPVARWKRAYAEERSAAIRGLTDAIDGALRRLTLNLESNSERELVETADRVCARVRGWTGRREPYGRRLPRLQWFAAMLSWLRMRDPARHGRLADSLRRYREELDGPGSGDADVVARGEVGHTLRDLIRDALSLVLSLPVAALGTFAWYLACSVSGLTSRLSKPDIETVATVKLLAGIVAFLATYLGWAALAYRVGGPVIALLTFLLLPPLGFAALAWWDRCREVSEDVRLFFRVIRRRDLRDRLAARRSTLAAEIERVAAEWEGQRAVGAQTRSPVHEQR